MKITGPALHNPLMQTADDPKGETILGTMQNCPTVLRRGAPI